MRSEGGRHAAVVPTDPLAFAMESADSGVVTPARTSRAGRNLPAAVAVGVGLGAVTIASLAFRKEGFLALCCVACVIGLWELRNAFAARQINVPIVPLVAGAIFMQLSAFYVGEQGLVGAFVATCLLAVVWVSLVPHPHMVRDASAAVFCAAYLPLLAGFAMLMLAEQDGVRRIVVFILVTIASDIGGYAVGVRFGRHPLAPSVSPKKSWEGSIGSALTCAVVGAVAVVVLLGGSAWAGVLCGLVAVVTATVGDLSESLLKRDLGIKDMGNILPGHGGVMDRLDSMLPTAPIMYAVLTLLVAATL